MSIDAIIVSSSQNTIASKWVDALVNVEAISGEARIVLFKSRFALAESNVFLGGINDTFTSLGNSVSGTTVHVVTKTKWIILGAALKANSSGEISDNCVNTPATNCATVVSRSISTLININTSSNTINSAFSHEACSAAVTVVLVLGSTSNETAETVESTPVVWSRAKTVWISGDVTFVATFVIHADAVTDASSTVGGSIVE